MKHLSPLSVAALALVLLGAGCGTSSSIDLNTSTDTGSGGSEVNGSGDVRIDTGSKAADVESAVGFDLCDDCQTSTVIDNDQALQATLMSSMTLAELRAHFESEAEAAGYTQSRPWLDIAGLNSIVYTKNGNALNITIQDAGSQRRISIQVER